MTKVSELKKFITSQYIYSGIRIALAVVIPCIILAKLGLLKEYFLFPLGTIFLALTDSTGPFHRRRNALIFAIVNFFIVSLIAGLLKDFPLLIFLEILVFGMFFTMLGVYGQRLAAVGSLTLVVFAIFIDGAPGNHSALYNSIIFSLGTIWFLLVFMIVTVLKPYKLAQQLIGENYIELGNYLKLKAEFYQDNPNFDELYKQIFSLQVRIKEHQEATREVVFKTREIVKESTSTSRLLMQLFLNSLDLYEMLLTSTNDYKKLQNTFGNEDILIKINRYLNLLADELINIGISIQGGLKTNSIINVSEEIQMLHENYYDFRKRQLKPETLENFMILRQIMQRISSITEEVQKIYLLKSQNVKLARSLSSGLDLEKFVQNEEKINIKVFLENFSITSHHFRHAIRITIALLIGYSISKIEAFNIDKTFWILITILAIMRPAYSITKRRNLLRLYGTLGGAIIGIIIINFITNPLLQLLIFLICLVLTFSFLKDKYAWSVFFMTIYIFLMFNFMKPGDFTEIFLERLIDTIIAGVIAFIVSYLVLPIWEHQKNKTFILNYLISNTKYFNTIIDILQQKNISIQEYKISRKNAVVTLANLSDNFQRMLSEPKNQQKNLENIHQFVTTSHLFTAYAASLSQYAQKKVAYPEIDFENWKNKINAELSRTKAVLESHKVNQENFSQTNITPEDLVNELLLKRKEEIAENEFYDTRDPKRISHLTELKNIRELLELIYIQAREQRKISEKISE